MSYAFKGELLENRWKKRMSNIIEKNRGSR